MMELVKEKREQRDLDETNKIMDAIHTQAKWNRVEEHRKGMIKKLDKKSKRKEVLRNELETALLLLISTIGLSAWGLIFMLLSK